MRVILLAILGLVAAIRAIAPLEITVVMGHSMEPTLRSGARRVLDRSYYRSYPLRRGDIVVFRLQGETYIKRVHALPGERLALLRYDDNAGDALLDPTAAARLRRLHAAGRLEDRWVVSLTIPPGHCFVVGDNDRLSIDSRHFGSVPVSAILGRIVG
jgi:signal peptidase I